MPRLKPSYPYYLAGRAVAANTDLEVRDKYTGKRATRVAMANARTVEKAIAAAVAARPAMADFPPDAVEQHVAARGACACAVHRGRQADR